MLKNVFSRDVFARFCFCYWLLENADGVVTICSCKFMSDFRQRWTIKQLSCCTPTFYHILPANLGTYNVIDVKWCKVQGVKRGIAIKNKNKWHLKSFRVVEVLQSTIVKNVAELLTSTSRRTRSK